MAKAKYQKTLKPVSKPKSNGVEVSFVEGKKQSNVKKPKSLTPLKKK